MQKKLYIGNPGRKWGGLMFRDISQNGRRGDANPEIRAEKRQEFGAKKHTQKKKLKNQKVAIKAQI